MDFGIAETDTGQVHGVLEAFASVVEFGKGPTTRFPVLVENAVLVHADGSVEIFHLNEHNSVLHDGDEVHFTSTFSTLDLGQSNGVMNLEHTRCFTQPLGDLQFSFGRCPFTMVHLRQLLLSQRGKPTIVCQPPHGSVERLTLLQASVGWLG